MLSCLWYSVVSMSEKDKYTELMAAPFVEGMARIHEVIVPGAPSVANVYAAQQLIRPLLKQLQWPQSGLPNKSFGTAQGFLSEHVLEPESYTERLMAFAFDDTHKIIKECERYATQNSLPTDGTFGELLLRGKQALLTIASLPDSAKSTLFSAFEHRDLSPILGHMYQGFSVIDQETICIGQDRSGRQRLEWSEHVQAYIQASLEPGRGCPAAQKIVTTPDGHKTTLMYYFWDKLVEGAFMHDSHETA